MTVWTRVRAAASPQNLVKGVRSNRRAIVIFVLMAYYYLVSTAPKAAFLAHVPTMVMCMGLVLKTVVGRVAPTKSSAALILICLIPFTRLLLVFDLHSLLFTGSQLIGTLAILVLFARERLPAWVLAAFLVTVVLPGFFLDLGTPVFNNSARSLFPTPGGGWFVHIGPIGTTVHFTAELGWLFILVALTEEEWSYKLRILAGAVGLYLGVFSRSRTALIIIAALAVVRLVNIRGSRAVRAALCVAVMAGGLLAIYQSQEFVDEYVTGWANQGVGNVLSRTGNLDDEDVTSGRHWLWNYHLRLFEQSPFRGAGLTETQFWVGDTVDHEYAQAAGESYYTEMLAAFGVFGMAFIALHLYLFIDAIRKQRVRAIMAGTTLILGTAANSMYYHFYTSGAIFLYAMLASDLRLFREGVLSRRIPGSFAESQLVLRNAFYPRN